MSEGRRRAFVVDDEKPQRADDGGSAGNSARAESGDRERRRGFTVSAEEEQQGEFRQSAESSAAEASTLDLDDSDFETEELPRTRFWDSPVLWALILILVVAGLQTYSLIINAFNGSFISGVIWTAGIAVVFALALRAVFREVRSVLELKAADDHRALVQKLKAEGTYTQASALCEELARSAHLTASKAWQNYSVRLQEHFAPVEVFALYEQQVLKAQDDKVRRIIIRRSTENGVIVALSPLAWLDMFLTLARSLRMIREISEVYGLRCGLWGRMQLYKRIARNLIFIGMADLATDALVDVFGAGTAAKLSASLGQGVAASVYSSRLGYMAVKAVRPLPLTPEVMTLGSLRRDLLTRGHLYELVQKSLGK